MEAFVALEPVPGRRQRIAVVALFFVAAEFRGGSRNDLFHPPASLTVTPTTNYYGTRIALDYSDYESESFCYNNGSLHQLALDMINFSSPPGSRSYQKLKHVLDLSSEFRIDMGGGNGIFTKNQEMMIRMLRGYGLHPAIRKPLSGPENVTLVETVVTRSTCSLKNKTCQNQPRILIQTEQYMKLPLLLPCHESPNCVILEFSDYNLKKAKEQNKGLLDSFVLLPVMTQVPSRMSHFEPTVPKPLHARSLDMVFFGWMTDRRKALTKGAAAYRKHHPGRKVMVQKNNNSSAVGNIYPEAKVCLLAHSYTTVSGGEYHRVSEFAPFGCIPVMEHFADTFGTHLLERCGGAIFTNLANIVPKAAEVIAKIDQGLYNDRGNAIIDWWKTGIHWERILPTVFGSPAGPN